MKNKSSGPRRRGRSSAFSDGAFASSPIRLPRPSLTKAGSVGKALAHRRTTREMSEAKLPLKTLSNLLWAANGVNRKKGPFGIPGRTAASASNSQEIDIYVLVEEGVYLYDYQFHRLIPILAGDHRSLAIGEGQSPAAKKAPVHLVYVVDLDRLVNSQGYQEPGLKDAEIQKSYYFADTGMIAGNVYLFAASEGLAAWFHNCNRKVLEEKLMLGSDQRALFGQTVGFPQ
ncbi:MAG TPA: nitroreductase family protein [Bacteroidota bacterium]|nr:nitroreductase family protein [Bacteroidota bacterium]